MVEDLEEGDGGSVSEEAPLRGLISAGEEEDCRDAAISSVEPRERLSHWFIPRIMIPGLRLMTEVRLILEL